MAEILFTYKGIETSIQSNIDDKMEEIINKYVTKSENISKKIYFVYSDYIVCGYMLGLWCC